MRFGILKIVGYTSTIIWFLAGLITIGSLYFSTSLIEVNFFVGILFIFFSFLLYKKEKNFLLLLENASSHQDSKIYKNVFFYEILFALISLFLGMVIFTAVFSRVLVEHFSVFG